MARRPRFAMRADSAVQPGFEQHDAAIGNVARLHEVMGINSGQSPHDLREGISNRPGTIHSNFPDGVPMLHDSIVRGITAADQDWQTDSVPRETPSPTYRSGVRDSEFTASPSAQGCATETLCSASCISSSSSTNLGTTSDASDGSQSRKNTLSVEDEQDDDGYGTQAEDSGSSVVEIDAKPTGRAMFSDVLQNTTPLNDVDPADGNISCEGSGKHTSVTVNGRDFWLAEQIGTGGSAHVHKAVCLKTRANFALKIINAKNLREFDSFKREVSFLEQYEILPTVPWH